jgi:hypothetical protein
LGGERESKPPSSATLVNGISPENPAGDLRAAEDELYSAPMKFALAILTFALFAFFISWGIIELLKGKPWLLLASVGIFLGTFIKFGCQSH